MSQPWRKLHRRVPTRWGMLPLFTRALGTELRRYSDDDDRIELGGHAPAAAIARLCGASPGDRRMLDRVIGELLACGYMTASVDALTLHPDVSGDADRPARGRREDDASAREPDTNDTRAVRESNASDTRTVHEAYASDTRDEHENEAKSPESFNSAPVEESRVEEKRGEERRVDRPRARVAAVPLESDPIESALRTGYMRRYQAATRDAWLTSARDDAEVKRAAAWCRAQEAPAEAAERFLDGAFAHQPWSKSRWPWKWLAEDPGLTASRSSMAVGTMGGATTMDDAMRAKLAAIPTLDLDDAKGEW